jgi:hypothetical protein
MSRKTLLPLLGFLLGLIGVIVCGAAGVVVWMAGSRLREANQAVYERIDETLGTVHGRFLDARTRVQESRVTTEEIQQSLKEVARDRTSKKLETQLEIEKKTETLGRGLQQADLWLQVSSTSLQSVHDALQLGNSIGAPVDPSTIEPLIGKLADLQSQLTQVSELVDGVRERAAAVESGETRDERIEQAADLALRAVVTFGKVDERLGETADLLVETQKKAQRLSSKTNAYIRAARALIMLLIAWMAAGQFSLGWSGWRAYRQFSSVD